MTKFTAFFKSSYQELKSIRCITLISMLGAVSIVLGSLVFMVGDFLKVGFNFLPNEFVYYLFGPVVGVVYGATLDLLTFIVRPTGPFFFGFTLSAIITGFLYGVILYKRPLSLKRILVANLVQLVVIHLLLNTYWLTMLYGYNFIAILPLRALKALIMLPVETIMLYMVIKGVEASGVIGWLFPGKQANITSK